MYFLEPRSAGNSMTQPSKIGSVTQAPSDGTVLIHDGMKITIGDYSLSSRDLATLRSTQWLTDAVCTISSTTLLLLK